MLQETTQLWFPIVDLMPLVEHCMAARSVEADPYHGTQPVLRLTAQGNLFYLTTNAYPPVLVNPFDPDSQQRVCAIGHSHHHAIDTVAADERYGPTRHLDSVALVTGGSPEILGQLVDQLRAAARVGEQWLVLTVAPQGPLRWAVRPFPHPAPVAHWRSVRLEIFGLPGVWPGQVVSTLSWRGFLLPRFAPQVAQHLADTLTHVADLPFSVTRVVVTGDPDDEDPGRVGVDPDGFYRIGTGWPWVSRDLLPQGWLLPYTDAPQPGDDPAHLPVPGQDTYTAGGRVMWLDANNDLVWRSVVDGGFDPAQPVRQPEYRDVGPEEGWRLRSVEHVLRRAAATRVTVTGLAAAFTPADLETLVITAADAVCAGAHLLNGHQRDLATRAYALHHRHVGETWSPQSGAGR
jgi:hypothetical protein